MVCNIEYEMCQHIDGGMAKWQASVTRHSKKINSENTYNKLNTFVTVFRKNMK